MNHPVTQPRVAPSAARVALSDPWHIGELPGDRGDVIRDQNGLVVCAAPSPSAAMLLLMDHEARVLLRDRERDTILAALRLWQATTAADINGDILAIAAGAYEHPPLDGREIDALCERLNVEHEA